eukprot:jgi/Picre1/31599/NNA_006951.t1
MRGFDSISAAETECLTAAQQVERETGSHIEPKEYNVSLHFDTELFRVDTQEPGFEGQTRVTVRMHQSVSCLLFHADNLTVDAIGVSKPGTSEISICSDTKACHHEFVLLHKQEKPAQSFEQNLYTLHWPGHIFEKDATYVISIVYRGVVSDKATDLEAPYDEAPVVLSNGKQSHLFNSSDGASRVVVFESTPIMSTYLVAFVSGKFDVVSSRSIEEVQDSIFEVRGWSIRGKDRISPAVVAGRKGAMENWGLLIFDEARLLDRNGSFWHYQMLSVVCHEVAHQWLGNMMTAKNWTELFLNEGFAVTVEYYCLHHIDSRLSTDVFRFIGITPGGEKQHVHDGIVQNNLQCTDPLLCGPLVPKSDLDLDDSLVYSRGAIALYSLLNEDYLFSTLQDLLKEYSFGTIDILNVIEQHKKSNFNLGLDAFSSIDAFPNKVNSSVGSLAPLLFLPAGLLGIVGNKTDRNSSAIQVRAFCAWNSSHINTNGIDEAKLERLRTCQNLLGEVGAFLFGLYSIARRQSSLGFTLFVLDFIGATIQDFPRGLSEYLLLAPAYQILADLEDLARKSSYVDDNECALKLQDIFYTLYPEYDAEMKMKGSNQEDEYLRHVAHPDLILRILLYPVQYESLGNHQETTHQNSEISENWIASLCSHSGSTPLFQHYLVSSNEAHGQERPAVSVDLYTTIYGVLASGLCEESPSANDMARALSKCYLGEEDIAEGTRCLHSIIYVQEYAIVKETLQSILATEPHPKSEIVDVCADVAHTVVLMSWRGGQDGLEKAISLLEDMGDDVACVALKDIRTPRISSDIEKLSKVVAKYAARCNPSLITSWHGRLAQAHASEQNIVHTLCAPASGRPG